MSTLKVCRAPTISAQKVRQRSCGSTPRTRITSRSVPGTAALSSSTSGQSILRVAPSTSSTWGRVVVKS